MEIFCHNQCSYCPALGYHLWYPGFTCSKSLSPLFMYLTSRNHVIQMNPNAQHRDILISLPERKHRCGITWPFEKGQVRKRTDVTDTHLNLLCQFKIPWTLMISAGNLVCNSDRHAKALCRFSHCEDDHCGLCEEPVKVSGQFIIMREKCVSLMCRRRGCSSKGQITVVAVIHWYWPRLQSAALFCDLSAQQNPRRYDGMCK